MDLLNAMRNYVAIVEAGSLVAAAEHLDSSTAAVSRQLAALESHLGARLLNRTTRRQSVTEVGHEFYRRAQQVIADIGEAEAIAGQHTSAITGLLRISAPLSFGISTLSQWLPGFAARYPDLSFDIDLSDRLVDLATEGVDVAVRIARQPASTNVVARKIADIHTVVCAAPSYLARMGTPREPADLTRHETLSFSYLSTGDTWHFSGPGASEIPVHIRPRIRATNGDVLRELAIQGAGIILQPTFIVEKDIARGSLVPILRDWSMRGFNLYAIYLNRKFLPAKVRTFIDYLNEAAEATPI